MENELISEKAITETENMVLLSDLIWEHHIMKVEIIKDKKRSAKIYSMFEETPEYEKKTISFVGRKNLRYKL